jgi:hypothetical protein
MSIVNKEDGDLDLLKSLCGLRGARVLVIKKGSLVFALVKVWSKA